MQKKEKRTTLNREITLLTMLTSVGALVLFGAAMICLFFYFFLGNIREDMEHILETTNQQYQDKIRFIEDGAVVIRHNGMLREFFDGGAYEQDEMEQQLSYSMELFSERNMTEQQPFVTSVCLFNKYGECLREHYYPMTVDAARSREITYQKLQETFFESKKQYWTLDGENELLLCFRLYDDEMQAMGTCILGIDKEAVKKIFREIEAYANSSWAVLSREGKVLLSYGEAEEVAALCRLQEHYSGIGEVGSTSALCALDTAGFGMRTGVSVGSRNVYTILKPTMITFLVVLFLTMIFIGTAAMGMSHRFSRPLKKMLSSIKAFGKENLDARMEDSSIQEIHDVSLVFNDMADHMKYLIEEVYEKQLLAARSQMKFLQAQINPHFQFNILAMLAVKAKLAGNEELYQCLWAFSKLVQGKIFREREIKILVSEEMELVEFYLFLQKERFGDGLSYEISYGNQEIRSYRIPRLLIEPIVENAVSHGIEPKSGQGHVKICLYEEENMLHILVEDDGVGYSEESFTAEEKNKKETSGISHTHTGLSNTRRLLQIMYGDNYTLHTESRKGQGTRVEIILPAEKGEG